LSWAATESVPMLDVEQIVLPSLRDGSANPDGMHWSWPVHRAIGEGLAALVQSSDVPKE